VRIAGEHVKADNCAGAKRFNEKLADAPFKLAVTVAAWSDPTPVTVAANAVLRAPPGIPTVPGTVTLPWLSVRAIVTPSAGAGPVKVTVHVVAPGVSIV
jgi:hypothetical protein